MNSKTVLNKIMQMLSLTEETLNFTDAKTEDGTILQSSNFDVNDDVFEISEDGTKTPAADGDYTISFTNPEGAQSTQVITVMNGKVAEISTPEEEVADETGTETEMADVDATMIKTQKLPSTGNEDEENVMPDVKNSVTSGNQKMAETTLPVGPLPQTEEAPNQAGEEIDMGKVMENMQYRIDEMSARIMKLEDAMTPPTDSIVTEEESGTMMSADEDEDLPKLDGAPVEDASAIHKFNTNRKNYGEKMVDAQSTFLSKLYN